MMEQKTAKIAWMVEYRGFIWLFDAALDTIGSQAFDWPVFRSYLRSGVKILPPGTVEFTETVLEPEG